MCVDKVPKISGKLGGPASPQFDVGIGPVVKGPLNILLHEQPTTAASRLIKLAAIAIFHQATAQSNQIRFYLSITPLVPRRRRHIAEGNFL